jgi:hypothetical protein
VTRTFTVSYCCACHSPAWDLDRVSVSQRRGRWAAVTAAGIALALAAVLCVMLQGRPGALAVDDMKTTAEKFFGTEGKGTYNAVSSDDSSPGQVRQTPLVRVLAGIRKPFPSRVRRRISILFPVGVQSDGPVRELWVCRELDSLVRLRTGLRHLQCNERRGVRQGA